MSLEPPGTGCFSGHLLSSQGLCPTCLGESPSNPVRTGIREGVDLRLGAPPSLIPALRGLEEAVFLTLPQGPSFSLPTANQLGLLPRVKEPRVGPAHPSRQPLAPAASGMLQPPSFSQQPWLPASRPSLPGPHWPAPTPQEPKVLLYITPGDVSIFIAVLKIHVFYTENHLLQPPSLPHPKKGFQTLVVPGAAESAHGLCRLR